MSGKQADIKAVIKQLLKDGLEEVHKQRLTLMERKKALLAEVQEVEAALVRLNEEMAAGIREGCKELCISTDALKSQKEKRTRKRGEVSMLDWILQLLAEKGPLTTNLILRSAEEAGLNPKSVSVQLSKMTQATKIQSKPIPGERGRVYSLAESKAE